MTLAILFPICVTAEDIPKISGLSYLQQYVSETEENDLIQAIDGETWDTTWKRRRQPYGSNYGSTKVSPPIPVWGRRLADRLLRENLTDQAFDQMLVNEYLPGQGIALHRDYESFGRTVISLSLLSSCVMDFRRVAANRKESLLLQHRSLLILQDEVRYDWQHGIAPRKWDSWHGVSIP